MIELYCPSCYSTYIVNIETDNKTLLYRKKVRLPESISVDEFGNLYYIDNNRIYYQNLLSDLKVTTEIKIFQEDKHCLNLELIGKTSPYKNITIIGINLDKEYLVVLLQIKKFMCLVYNIRTEKYILSKDKSRYSWFFAKFSDYRNNCKIKLITFYSKYLTKFSENLSLKIKSEVIFRYKY
jgi:hypothetical protein